MKHNSILLCLLFIVTTNLVNTAKAQAVNTTDSLALVDLYNATNGPNWYYHTNWLTTQPVSTWYGIGTNGDRVVSITLPFNVLTGALPASFSNLTALTDISLANNYLSGEILSAILHFDSLRNLVLDNNKFTGAIPSAISNLTQLAFFSASENKFSGSIPASIATLSNLTNISLSKNNLTGSIPPAIFNTPKLSSLDLGVNKLSGTIPATVGNATALTFLYLNFDHLSGHIPASIGKLTNLAYFNLSGNNLMGNIPYTLGNLTKLSRLYLAHNELTGTIPGSFKNLNLYTLDISYNHLTQTGNVDFPFVHNQTSQYIFSHNNFKFDGLEFVAEKAHRAQYAPQAAIEVYQLGDSLAVSAGGTLSNNTYKWYIAGQSNPVAIIGGDSTFTPTSSGSYYAYITNSVATQLTLTTDTIIYTAPQRIHTLTSFAKTNSTHFSVYPNPASNVIHVQTNGKADIVLTNSGGKILLIKSIYNSADINVNEFTNGTYYLQNKTTGEVEKIVVVH